MNDVFDTLIGRWRDLCFQFMRTTLVSHGNLLVAPVIGWVLCAPKYLVGTMSLGEAAQAVAAFVMVQSALNWLVDNYPGLAECLSSVNRVGSLLAALDELDRDDEHQVDYSSAVVSGTQMIPLDTTTPRAGRHADEPHRRRGGNVRRTLPLPSTSARKTFRQVSMRHGGAVLIAEPVRIVRGEPIIPTPTLR